MAVPAINSVHHLENMNVLSKLHAHRDNTHYLYGWKRVTDLNKVIVSDGGINQPCLFSDQHSLTSSSEDNESPY